MELITKKDNKLVFLAKIEDSLVNAIRRFVNEIPIFAIDEINVSKNDSPLYDETVAHRVGLIPLKMEKGIKEGEILNLEVKKEGAVVSGDLKGKVKLVYDNIPITFLNKDQSMKFEGIVSLGKGITHSKFSSGLIFYRNVCEISLDKNFAEEIKKVCSNVEVKEKGGKAIILDNKEIEVEDVCMGICEKNRKECEVSETGDVVISVESFGQLEVKDVFVKSIEELKKGLKSFSKNFK